MTSTVIFCERSPCATAVVTSAMLRTWLVRLSASVFTESVRSFHVPLTPFTRAWPPSLPSVPTSRATRVTSSAKDESWSTIVLIVFFSWRISPLTSTVILRLRSPSATAVVTSAMLRTWPVRFDAMKLTLSVRSFQTPDTPSTRAWPPRMPSVPTSRATRVTSAAKERSWSTIVLMVSFSSRISPRAVTVIFFERSPCATAVVTSAMLRTWPVRLSASVLTLSVRSFHVPDTPSTFAWPPSLPSVPTSFATRVTSSAKERELVDHRVDRVLELEDLALDVDRDLLGEIAGRDRRRHLGDVADLGGEVVRERVDVVGEVLPDARDALHVGLTAEDAAGADLAGDARDLAGERAQRVDHRVDRVRELRDLSLRLDRELAVEVAVRDRGDDARDAAHLRRQVRRHEVHVVREVLPGAADALHARLAAELSFGADLARDARHLVRERGELVDHRVDRVLELEDLALDVDADLLRQVAGRDRRRHLGDVANLCGQVRRHQVDVVGEVLPDARGALHLGLAAELAFGADLARDARHLVREGRELVDHRVDGRADPAELAAHRAAVDLQLHLLREVAVGDRIDDARDLGRLTDEVVDHAVHRGDRRLPGAAVARQRHAFREAALAVDDAGDALDLLREVGAAVGEVVVRLRKLAGEAALPLGQPQVEVAGVRGAQCSEQLSQCRFVDRAVVVAARSRLARSHACSFPTRSGVRLGCTGVSTVPSSSPCPKEPL